MVEGKGGKSPASERISLFPSPRERPERGGGEREQWRPSANLALRPHDEGERESTLGRGRKKRGPARLLHLRHAPLKKKEKRGSLQEKGKRKKKPPFLSFFRAVKKEEGLKKKKKRGTQFSSHLEGEKSRRGKGGEKRPRALVQFPRSRGKKKEVEKRRKKRESPWSPVCFSPGRGKSKGKKSPFPLPQRQREKKRKKKNRRRGEGARPQTNSSGKFIRREGKKGKGPVREKKDESEHREREEEAVPPGSYQERGKGNFFCPFSLSPGRGRPPVKKKNTP